MRHLVVYFAIIFAFPTLCWGQIICGDSTSSNVSFQHINFDLLNLGPAYSPTVNPFSLDIDNDNINDIKFEKYHSYSSGHSNNDTWISNLNSVEFIITLTDTISLDTVQRGSSINNSLNWKSSLSLFHIKSDDYNAVGQSHHGIFDTLDRFIGFRKTNSSLCGWIYVKLLKSGNAITGISIKSIAKSVLQPQSIKEYQLNRKVLIMPVPASDKLTLLLTDDKKEFTKAQIVNSFGQVIKEIDLSFANKETTIDINDCSSGIYILKLLEDSNNDNKEVIIKRFVIAR